MFTINIYLRFALIAICLLGGVILAFAYSFWYALPFILVGIILLVGYFLMGTVQSAAVLMQQQDFNGAEKRLALTIKPEWLFSVNRSYYYMMQSTLSMQKGDTAGSQQWLSKAENTGFNSDNEKAMALLQMLGIHAQKSQWPQVNNLLRQLKELNVTMPEVKEQIKEIDKAMSQRGQVQTMGRMPGGNTGAFKPGGKRPRPKMR